MTRTRWEPADAVAPALAIIGFLLSASIYFPGLFTPDSIEQFAQAQTGHFADWHPPVMAMVWRGFNFLFPGPALLFTFHLGLFWTGLWAMGDGLRRHGLAYGMLFPLIGLLPFVFNYLGLLWKDVALAASWIFAAGLAFRWRASQTKLPPAVQILIWAAFFYGALVRANTIFAAAPLAFYLYGADLFARRQWPKIVAMLIVPPMLFVGTAAFNKYAAHAEPQYPVSSLFLFDLAGISHRLGDNLIPGPWTPAQAKKIPECYGSDKWDHTGMGDCAFVTATLDDKDLTGSPLLARAWLSAITQHPALYLAHRLAFANQIFRWLGPVPVRDSFLENELSDPRYANVPGPFFRAVEEICDALTNTPLFRPYLWLLIAIGASALSVAAEDSPARRFAVALSLSAAIYLLTYIPFGVGSDFRYAYWSIIATLSACAALLACTWKHKRLMHTIAAASAIGIVSAAIASAAS